MATTPTDNTPVHHPLPAASILPAGPPDIPLIQQIVDVSWPDTYGRILSEAQLSYMLDMMYNTQTLEAQMRSTHHYSILWENSADDSNAATAMGFIDVEKQDSDYCKLHKIYLLPASKGKGYGKLLMEYALQQSKSLGCRFVKLNVNRYNNALGFYERMGFTIAETVDNPIGNGYYMNDYVMIKPLDE
ncbi:Acetyltransferase (GNAT) domain-containing protein [Arachidicoccus rhizosphaerae]|uniref:Acetyltransferase (GNAT) domain-containing protein n=1 Tax=Arachidicoccus rhizosphaerae TaxID=551991 RepID=A0A1H4CIH8_9BACT|nr:GNAT family N-acetyltransferase [Arachidicoccus rhizosphaerae]SEA60157.1 Acetyltransferase (GNAT) domain-containing protein [Arachidicoccus rhizosphaerae]